MSLLLAVGTTPESITIDKWYKQHENPIRKGLKVAAVIASSFFFVPIDSNADWLSTTQSQPIVKSKRIYSTETRVEVVIPSDVITIDKWLQPISQPYKRKYPLILSNTELVLDFQVPPVPIATGNQVQLPTPQGAGGVYIFKEDYQFKSGNELDLNRKIEIDDSDIIAIIKLTLTNFIV